MNEEVLTEQPANKIAKLPLLAALVALVGLCDAIYLTIHHYTGEKVPCSVTGGCEAVLSSSYAEIGGIPLAVFGAAAYFIAFSLAILAAFGNRLMWKLFGFQVTIMAIFSVYLLYVQKYEIREFCQYCLLSAAVCVTLFAIALFSRFWRT
ncbi:MAG TPA: vitamin K epoxide reductase family protein [Pyrinomonadaceae bacterium]|nr:vitamin K epoxide reductase family protein [Pyrinomonadaceae bacterium]